MDKRKYIKKLTRLALPTVIGNIFTFLIGFTDHIMTAGLERGAIGGIFLSNQIGTLLQFIITGIEATVTVLAAREDAEGEGRAFNKTVLLALYSASGVALLTTIVCTIAPKRVLSLFSSNGEIVDTGAPFLRLIALSFIPFALSRIIMTALRARQQPKPSLYLPAITFATNLALNFLLIGSRGSPISLGSIGAAAATLISRILEFAIGAFLIMRSGTFRLSRKLFTKPRDSIRLFLRTALPILIGQVAWAANTFLMTAIMSKVGEGIAATAFGAASAVHNLAYTVMNGTSSAVGVLTSRAVGEKRLSLEVCRTAEVCLLVAGAVGSLLILLLSPTVLSLYHLTESDLSAAYLLSLVFVFSFPLTTYSAGSLFGIVKSSGDVGFVSRVDTLLFLLLTLPTSLLAYFGGATPTVTLAVLKLVDLAKCPIAYLYIERRWKFTIDKPHRV